MILASIQVLRIFFNINYFLSEEELREKLNTIYKISPFKNDFQISEEFAKIKVSNYFMYNCFIIFRVKLEHVLLSGI